MSAEQWDSLKRTLEQGPDASRRLRQRARALDGLTPRPTLRRLLPATLALAALSAVAITALVLWPRPLVRDEAGAALVPGADLFALTARQLRFDEGSEVVLEAGGHARLAEVDGKHVEMVLEAGRLEAHVTKGTGRTWRYHAGEWVVRVVGTRLSVAWDPSAGALQVGVTEGAVEVSGPGGEVVLVKAGQALSRKTGAGSGARRPGATPAGVLDSEGAQAAPAQQPGAFAADNGATLGAEGGGQPVGGSSPASDALAAASDDGQPSAGTAPTGASDTGQRGRSPTSGDLAVAGNGGQAGALPSTGALAAAGHNGQSVAGTAASGGALGAAGDNGSQGLARQPGVSAAESAAAPGEGLLEGAHPRGTATGTPASGRATSPPGPAVDRGAGVAAAQRRPGGERPDATAARGGRVQGTAAPGGKQQAPGTGDDGSAEESTAFELDLGAELSVPQRRTTTRPRRDATAAEPDLPPTAPPATWKLLLLDGKRHEALLEASRAGALTRADLLSDVDALALADAARLERRFDVSRQLLSVVLARNGSDAAEAAFLLGRIEVDAHQPGAAVTFFRRTAQLAPAGPFAEQAQGRLMECLVELQDTEAARKAATDYLRTHPQGAWAGLANRIVAGAQGR